MSGVQVGLNDLHVAILTKDDETGVAYEAPIKIAGAITAKITPTENTETLYADDGPAEIASSMGEITVELSVKDLPMEIQAVLFGHALENGILIKQKDDQAPYVALGFKSLKSNKRYRYVWLLKGKFRLPEQSYQTKEEKVSFQAPSISASFVVRNWDGRWQVIGDDDVSDFHKGVAENWFVQVYDDQKMKEKKV
jgi:phi13 family phage major tail protein